jgi:hypothetical protein
MKYAQLIQRVSARAVSTDVVMVEKMMMKDLQECQLQKLRLPQSHN